MKKKTQPKSIENEHGERLCPRCNGRMRLCEDGMYRCFRCAFGHTKVKAFH